MSLAADTREFSALLHQAVEDLAAIDDLVYPADMRRLVDEHVDLLAAVPASDRDAFWCREVCADVSQGADCVRGLWDPENPDDQRKRLLACVAAHLAGRAYTRLTGRAQAYALAVHDDAARLVWAAENAQPPTVPHTVTAAPAAADPIPF